MRSKRLRNFLGERFEFLACNVFSVLRVEDSVEIESGLLLSIEGGIDEGKAKN